MYQSLSSLQAQTAGVNHLLTATQKAEAVSTVKLLNIAAQQGMPILHITSANSTKTIPSLEGRNGCLSQPQYAGVE
ncbi:MAG: hypothetical protein R8K21_05165 [Mariprofundales bacterium]